MYVTVLVCLWNKRRVTCFLFKQCSEYHITFLPIHKYIHIKSVVRQILEYLKNLYSKRILIFLNFFIKLIFHTEPKVKYFRYIVKGIYLEDKNMYTKKFTIKMVGITGHKCCVLKHVKNVAFRPLNIVSDLYWLKKLCCIDVFPRLTTYLSSDIGQILQVVKRTIFTHK